MEYEFHVGDYVETVDGSIGWVSYVFRNYITMKSKEGIVSGPWSIPEEQYHFKRIGQYNFTKKDEVKIEPLREEYTKSFPICEVTNMGYTSKCYSFDLGVVGKKINELIEAVNELRNKND